MALELVTKITANSETINAVVPWDGETNPLCMIIGQYTQPAGLNGGIQLNNDTGSNYRHGNIYHDSSTPLASMATNDLAYLFHRGSTGASACSSRATVFLQNVGAKSRSWESTMFHYSANNNDRYAEALSGYWINDVDPVTSITVLSGGTCTGNVWLYKF